MAYDLSFAEAVDIPQTSPGPIPGTAFAEEGLPQTAAEKVEQIEQQRSEGGFPQKPREGFWNQMRGAVMGTGRETNATRNLPDIAEVGLANFFGDGSIGNAAAVLSTYDPAEQVEILSSRYPDLQVASDEAGNVILSYQGKTALLNRPGFSRQDAARVGGTMAAFAPAAKATPGAGILWNFSRVGGQSAATQAGLEANQALQGGDFSGGEIALAGGAGGVAQGVFQGLSQALAPLAQVIRSKYGPVRISDGIRNEFKKYAVDLGYKPEEVSDQVIESVLRSTPGGSPQERVGQTLEREFKIPLTQGQRSLDQPQLRFEDEMSQGVRGAGAERRMREFGDEQRNYVERAAGNLESELTMGADVDNAPGIVRQGVRSAEETASQAVSEAYDIGMTAELNPDGFRNMVSGIRRSALRDESFDSSLPETSKLLSEMQSTLKTMRDVPKVGGRLKPLTLKRLEQYRRRIGTALESASGNPADKRQVTIIKRQWDDYLDRAVEQKLFSGNPDDLADLQEAREVFSAYAEKFRQNPTRGRSGRMVDSDPAGKFVERMIDANPTDEEILNAVFGASSINKKDGVAMWKRFNSILADSDPEAMMALKGAALRRLMKYTNVNGQPQLSGSKTITEIQKAMEKSGSLMREIFGEDELRKVQRFAAAVKRTQPDIDRGRSNPSGSGMTVIRQLVRLLGMGSFEPAMVVTEIGAGSARAGAGSSQASSALRPFSRLQAGQQTSRVVGAEAATADARSRIAN